MKEDPIQRSRCCSFCQRGRTQRAFHCLSTNGERRSSSRGMTGASEQRFILPLCFLSFLSLLDFLGSQRLEDDLELQREIQLPSSLYFTLFFSSLAIPLLPSLCLFAGIREGAVDGHHYLFFRSLLICCGSVVTRDTTVQTNCGLKWLPNRWKLLSILTVA